MYKQYTEYLLICKHTKKVGKYQVGKEDSVIVKWNK